MTERDLVTFTRNYLRLQKSRGLLTFHRMNTAGTCFRGKLTPNKDTKGFSDFIILAHGRIGFLELKQRLGKVTQCQIEFLEDKREHGAKAAVVRTPDEVRDFVKELLKGDMSSGGY